MIRNLYSDPILSVSLHMMVFCMKRGDMHWKLYREQIFGALSVYYDLRRDRFEEQYEFQWIDQLWHICDVSIDTFWNGGVHHG